MFKIVIVGLTVSTTIFAKPVKTCVNEAFEASAKVNEKFFVPSDENDDPRFRKISG